MHSASEEMAAMGVLFSALAASAGSKIRRKAATAAPRIMPPFSTLGTQATSLAPIPVPPNISNKAAKFSDSAVIS